jgi:FkbM family methyltransferase
VTASVNIRFEGRPFTLDVPGEDDYIATRLARTGTFYEADLLSTLARVPWPQGAVCLDVGANLGNHSVFFAAVLGLTVHSFEPDPVLAALCATNGAQNAAEGQVQVSQVALGEEDGSGRLERTIATNSGTGRIVDGDDVSVRRFDGMTWSGPDPVLVKIDVEGHEPAVIAGMRKMLQRAAPMLVVEAEGAAMAARLLRALPVGMYEVADIAGLTDNLILVPTAGVGDASSEQLLRILQSYHVRRTDRENTRRAGAIERSFARVEESLVRLESHAADGSAPELARLYQSYVAQVVSLRDAMSGTVALHGRELGRLRQQLHRARTEAAYWSSSFESLRTSRPLAAVRRVRTAAGKELDVHRPVGDDVHRARITKQVRAVTPPRFPGAPSPLRPSAGRPMVSMASRDRVRVGMAAIPSRVEALERVVSTMVRQADEVCVYLNGFDEVPTFLLQQGVRVATGEDLGDRGKFAFLYDHDGYYITVDDDIEYPPYYVEHLIDGIERYRRQAVVSWHGSIVKAGFKDFYSPASRQVLSFRSERGQDTLVHISGTGCTGFHTDTVKPTMDVFERSNMADLYFSDHCESLSVPRIVLAHRANQALPIEVPDSIYHSSRDRAGSAMDVGALSTAFVADHLKGVQISRHKPVLDAGVTRAPFTVGIFGRVDQARWKKGGILKSSYLLRDMLMGLGVDVRLLELEGLDAATSDDVPADVVLVYPGDPERPDFAEAESLVRRLASRGVPVLVNLSYDLRPSRTEFIRSWLTRMHAEGCTSVRAMVFTDAAASALGEDLAFTIPKSIEVPQPLRRSYEETHGVFVGDYGKLCRPELLDHPVQDWLDAIREATDGAPIYAVRQYAPAVDMKLDVDVVPFATDLAALLRPFRAMVSPFRHCTFEMVPVEAAATGMPVLYRSMPQSLDEVLRPAGVRLGGPADLAVSLRRVYDDPTVWAHHSEAGARAASAWSHRLQATALYERLQALAAAGRG